MISRSGTVVSRTHIRFRSGRFRSIVFLLLMALIVPLAACSDGEMQDELQVVENPTVADPATSPETSTAPAGNVVPQEHAIESVATDEENDILAVAIADPPAVLLYDLDDPDRVIEQIELPAPAETLTVAAGTLLAPLPEADTLARITLPEGTLDTVSVEGAPTGATVREGQTLVALRDQKGIAVLEDGDRVETITDDLYSADDVLTVGSETVVLDRLRTAIFRADVADGTIEEGLRAGMGATQAVVDSYDRVLVADGRGDGLLMFSLDPLLLRQRYPVPGGLYGLTYDPERDLVWVTLTERNEVVGFDIRGGEPSEVHRYPTVQQPNSVTVEEHTSRVIVGSATGKGIQVITP